VLGWPVDPWAYVLHAMFAYGLLALVCLHVAAVFLHRRSGLDLSQRIVGRRQGAQRVISAAAVVLAALAVLIVMGAARGHLTLGPAESPRDYSR